MGLRVFVPTSDKYLWAVRPFAYLFNVYYSSLTPVVISGYSPPNFPLPANFDFVQINEKEYPSDKWSDGFIQLLNFIEDDYFVLMLEDYWLTRTVDIVGITTLYEYMRIHTDVLRMDLTTDRLHARGDARDAHELESWGHYDLVITTDVPYQMSLQAAIWNKRLLLKILEFNKSPWETEIYTVVPPEMLVLGTRQWPLRYANAIHAGNIDLDQIEHIPEPHKTLVKEMLPT